MHARVFENEKLVYRNVNYVPGLYKIFDEILVNAADNKTRDSKMDTLKINIDKENNKISVYNNGRGIPIEVHKEEGIYVPELIFGHLLTSSNYDDNQKKITGGRNGYGAKLCTEFIIETADSNSEKKFKQIFSDNMSVKSKAVITENKKKENYTKITFSPDLTKFGMDSLNDDLEALFKKRAYDLAGCLNGVNVYLNDQKLKIKDFKQYVELYISSSKGSTDGATSRPGVFYQRFNDRWEIAVTISDGQFQQVSFVNSICTSKGGTHVNYVSDQIVATLLETIKKKDKKSVTLKPFQCKSHLSIFINCLIENPAFDSQTKENMTLKSSAFGSKCTIDDDFMKKVLKSGILETIMSFAQFKQQQALKKTDGKKNSRITGIAKLDDANNAGSRNGSQCTLILTEGDSAKTLAVSGLGVIGRDNYGVFPLRGKLLNVREANHSQIMNNAEISAIKQIMGLKTGQVYTDTSTLRYGHIMIMTDQDHDGSHIKGLIINLLDHFWPSLLKVPNFLLEFITPIVKVTKKNQERTFFTIPEYEEWKSNNMDAKGWHVKYYKGLGTSSTQDAKKYFSNLHTHMKEFRTCSENDRNLINMAFNKKKADERKEWLRNIEPGTFMDHSQQQIPLNDFINKELILFSMADNIRSIPSMVDGLKPGQRKILFCCFKRNLVNEIKVAQFAGYVSEHSSYHHGEQSLCTTIVGLAQNFVGSNNLPLLEPLGQFGTRLQGGKDSASPRYIFTKLNSLARAVYHPADDAILKYLNDDGQNIEPEWYIPILPMILMNGCDGIGTGWSTSMPNYNPRDIVENIFLLMEGKEPKPMCPYYRGFKGTIEKQDKGNYKATGIIRKLSDTTVEITELPLKTWTQSYKEQLEEWLVGTPKVPAWISDYKEYHTDSMVHFVVTLTEENLAKAEAEGLEKKFKLTTSLAISNMVCFDAEGRIQKYDTTESILKEFFSLRLQFYQRRKAYMLEQLAQEWTKLDNKVRFVLEIIEGTLIISNRKKADIISELKKKKYTAILKVKDLQKDAPEDLESQGDNGYDYLLSMPIWSLTLEKVQKLIDEKNQKDTEVLLLTKQTPQDLWRTDLDHFLQKWEVFEEEMYELETKEVTGVSKLKAGISSKKIKKKLYDTEEDDSDEFTAEKKPKSVAKKPAAKNHERKVDEITASVANIKLEKQTVKKRTVKKNNIDEKDTTTENKDTTKVENSVPEIEVKKPNGRNKRTANIKILSEDSNLSDTTDDEFNMKSEKIDVKFIKEVKRPTKKILSKPLLENKSKNLDKKSKIEFAEEEVVDSESKENGLDFKKKNPANTLKTVYKSKKKILDSEDDDVFENFLEVKEEKNEKKGHSNKQNTTVNKKIVTKIILSDDDEPPMKITKKPSKIITSPPSTSSESVKETNVVKRGRNKKPVNFTFDDSEEEDVISSEDDFKVDDFDMTSD
ncbi:DNA topoisomerase 2 [Clydaea vesicula]|uniref:DNA topoisomerase 2 n=1 Tax=Clydaea vesicula TaxID=447962 RepID=A0AAD5U5Q9_9FUNG|nr:DNA topoisomerase 2 [Clydaea vesicula]